MASMALVAAVRSRLAHSDPAVQRDKDRPESDQELDRAHQVAPRHVHGTHQFSIVAGYSPLNPVNVSLTEITLTPLTNMPLGSP